tara:strand:- start:319 stop:504 length:186 start_codon:yes stop_codon:yes gene_type:complete
MIKTHNNKIIKNIIKGFKSIPTRPPPHTEQTFYCWFGAIKNNKKQLEKVNEFKYKIVLPKN